MSLLKTIFSRKWIATTLLVLAGMAVLIRLGLWQLDRLQQRRQANAALMAVLESEPLILTGSSLPADVEGLEDRRVRVTGEFDLAAQVGLLVQRWNGRAGVHLITPLRIAGSDTAVLVDRGWVPQADFDSGNLAAYDVTGTVQVEGVVALSQNPPRYGNPELAPSGPQTAVYRVDVAQLQAQMPYELLPLYVIQAPPPEGNVAPPFRELPAVDLSQGPHLSYALQWFLFTLILGGGYLVFVYRQGQKNRAASRPWHGLWGLLLAVSLSLPPAAARAHGGGKLQIANAPVGECLVSVWSAPATPRAGAPLHLTVGLAAAATETPVLDGVVQVWLVAAESGERVAEAAATTAQSVNKLFYEADLPPLPAGSYTVTAATTCLGETGQVDFPLAIRPSGAPVYVILPLAGGGMLLGWLLWRNWRRREETAAAPQKSAL